MRKPVITFLFTVLLSTLMGNLAFAQEGHPLKGSWIGEWTGNETHGDFVLMVLDWDGKNVTGVINPGTDNMVIDKVELDPSDWSVTIEANGYVLEGTIEQLEIPSRSVSGTWKNGNRSGSLAISRQ